MPLEIGDGKLWLPEPKQWTLDVETGEAVLSKPIAEMDLNMSSNVAPKAVSIAANAKSPGEPLVHFWSACLGAGRANEGLRASWLEQLKLVHDECGFQYVRFHGLFHGDMFVYHRTNGEPVYNWQYIDDLFDRMLEIGVRPFVELGFNPIDPPGGRLIDGASVSGTTTLTNESADASTNGFRRGGLGGNRGAAIGQFWWRGNAVPPSDNERWAELVERFTRHCISVTASKKFAGGILKFGTNRISSHFFAAAHSNNTSSSTRPARWRSRRWIQNCESAGRPPAIFMLFFPPEHRARQ